MSDPGRVTVRRRAVPGDPERLDDLIAAIAPLAPDSRAEVLLKGGVWVTRARGPGARKTVRVRDGAAAIRPGDLVEVFRDPAILAVDPPEPVPIDDRGGFSAWFKPAGLMAQGTRYGDHASLVRRVEIALARPVFLVHRLDREACGVMVVAHDARAAGDLSRSFRDGRVAKEYRAVVVGDVAAALGAAGTIDAPLDGKPSTTRFRVLARDAERDRSWLAVDIPTGRKHQIRRHLDGAGFPVLGDPRYGRGNKNRDGLRLAAVSLAFEARGGPVRFEVPSGRIPWLDAAPPGAGLSVPRTR